MTATDTTVRDAAHRMARAALPLPGIDDPGFASWIDRFADRRVVLLGESTHGTAEFYRARARLTERLVTAHGFKFVAVEADWPDAASIDCHIRARRALAPADAPPFSRFPTWMWRNTEIVALVESLRAINAERQPPQKVAFYGLDIYSMRTSMAAVLAYLDRVDPAAATQARRRYACLDPWRQAPSAYGRAVISGTQDACERGVIAQLKDLLDKRLAYVTAGEDHEAFFDAAQNARLVASAERYYRIMYHGSAASWNLRDTHMFETLMQLLARHGPDSKAVVWAHNSHIGDASATAMGAERGETNIGQLCRDALGEQVALVGLDTYSGTVAAASDWDSPMQVKQVRPAHPHSYAHIAHESGLPRALLDLREDAEDSGAAGRALRDLLLTPRQERFIGVVYRPDSELLSHYMQAILPRQFDAWLWFDHTHALHALPTTPREGVPDTWPFGL